MASNKPSRLTQLVVAATAVAGATLGAYNVYIAEGRQLFNDVRVNTLQSASSITGATLSVSSTVDISGTASGSRLIVDPSSTGTGWLTITGGGGTGTGGGICVQDNDGAGFSKLSCLNGTCTWAIVTTCPTG